MASRAYDIARKKLFYCRENDGIPKIADIMQLNGIGSVLVKDKSGKVVGIITVGDVLRLIKAGEDVYSITADMIMKYPIVSVNKDISIAELVDRFHELKTTRLVLTDDKGEYVGVVRDSSAFRSMPFLRFDEEAKRRFDRIYDKQMF